MDDGRLQGAPGKQSQAEVYFHIFHNSAGRFTTTFPIKCIALGPKAIDFKFWLAFVMTSVQLIVSDMLAASS